MTYACEEKALLWIYSLKTTSRKKVGLGSFSAEQTTLLRGAADCECESRDSKCV